MAIPKTWLYKLDSKIAISHGKKCKVVMLDLNFHNLLTGKILFILDFIKMWQFSNKIWRKFKFREMETKIINIKNRVLFVKY